MKNIYIKKINAENIGPLKKLDKEFSPSFLYVIYGKNETGKTFLVEFIIKTLFSNTEFWRYTREIDGKGKITISGIEEKDIEFAFLTNKKRKTLDKLLENKNSPLTPSLAKILLVKGGEVDLDENVLSKSLLRELLLKPRVFEEIDSDSNISKTVKNARIEDNKLIISKQGEGREYYEIRKKLENIDKLIRKVAEELNLAEISNLELSIKELKNQKENLEKAKRYKAFKISQEIKKIDEELLKFPTISELEEISNKIQQIKNAKKNFENYNEELKQKREEREELSKKEEEYQQQLKAKRYLAYKISKEIENLKKELEKYPEDKINNIKTNIEQHKRVKDDYEEKTNEANKLREKIKNLTWVDSAYKTYAEFLEKRPKEPLSKIFIYLSLILVLLGIIFSLAEIKILSIISILTGLLTGGIYIYSLLKAFKDLPKIKELEKIKKQFKEKFNQDLTSIADINSKKQELEMEKQKLDLLDIEKAEDDLKKLYEEISKELKELTGKDIEPQNWEGELKNLENKIKNLKDQISGEEKKLASLNIPENEWVSTDPGIEYDPVNFERLEKEITIIPSLEKEISKLEKDLSNLEKEIKSLQEEIKKKLKKWLGKDIEENQWENEVFNLKKNIEEKEKHKKELEGELKGLGIDESEYLEEDPGIPYNPNKLKQIENELKQKEKEKEEKEKELFSLKGEIRGQLGIDLTTPWDEILSLLFKVKEETEKELKKTLAKIVAGILVHQAIEEIKKEEEKFLIEAINCDEVTKVLKKLTAGKYQQIKIEGDDIIISSNIEDYNIKDLSTGAKEQVLLALRIGIVQKLLGNNSGFLVLDDAFQHVDWERRPLIIDSLIQLSKSGWQIFYFTMDDHIKGLFEEKKKHEKNIEIIYF